MDIANFKPNVASWYELMYVATPSGILCAINAIVFKTPNLYRLFDAISPIRLLIISINK